MSKQIVKTDKAPVPVAPYSQATVYNGLVFTSGQIGMAPGSSSIVGGGVQAEAKQVLENLKAVLEAAGSSLDNALKVTVFLNDITDFGAVNEIYGQYFTQNHPARSAFQVGKLPLGALVEIEIVAYVG